MWDSFEIACTVLINSLIYENFKKKKYFISFLLVLALEVLFSFSTFGEYISSGAEAGEYLFFTFVVLLSTIISYIAYYIISLFIKNKTLFIILGIVLYVLIILALSVIAALI